MQESGKKTFLGLNEEENGPYDIVILPIPYEITTSYREGTEFGPEAVSYTHLTLPTKRIV